jgi:1,4-alpha-glucan branching enzyme
LGQNRFSRYGEIRHFIEQHEGGLDAFSRGYEKLGFTRRYTSLYFKDFNKKKF